MQSQTDVVQKMSAPSRAEVIDMLDQANRAMNGLRLTVGQYCRSRTIEFDESQASFADVLKMAHLIRKIE